MTRRNNVPAMRISYPLGKVCLFSLIAASVFYVGFSHSQEGYIWTVSPPKTRQGEQVVLKLVNNSEEDITVSDGAPWEIFDAEGNKVYVPVEIKMLGHLGEVDFLEWTWDQKDNDGNQVPRGEYRARIKFSQLNKSHTLRVNFVIE